MLHFFSSGCHWGWLLLFAIFVSIFDIIDRKSDMYLAIAADASAPLTFNATNLKRLILANNLSSLQTHLKNMNSQTKRKRAFQQLWSTCAHWLGYSNWFVVCNCWLLHFIGRSVSIVGLNQNRSSCTNGFRIDRNANPILSFAHVKVVFFFSPLLGCVELWSE